MVAVRIAPLRKENGRPPESSGNPLLHTQVKAAQLLNVSTDGVKAARVVQEKGTPDLIKAVDAGQLAVHTAKSIVHLSPKEQLDIITEKKTSRTTPQDIAR